MSPDVGLSLPTPGEPGVGNRLLISSGNVEFTALITGRHALVISTDYAASCERKHMYMPNQ